MSTDQPSMYTRLRDLLRAEHPVALVTVVARLGNTPAIARKSYVHPSLIALVKTGQGAFRRALRLPRSARHLSREERGLIAFLEAGTPSTAPLKAAA